MELSANLDSFLNSVIELEPLWKEVIEDALNGLRLGHASEDSMAITLFSTVRIDSGNEPYDPNGVVLGLSESDVSIGFNYYHFHFNIGGGQLNETEQALAFLTDIRKEYVSVATLMVGSKPHLSWIVGSDSFLTIPEYFPVTFPRLGFSWPWQKKTRVVKFVSYHGKVDESRVFNYELANLLDLPEHVMNALRNLIHK